MTTIRYNPNQPARQENASALAQQIMRDAKREIVANGGELTKAERDDLLVIYNTARETAEEELGAFNGRRLSEQDALTLVKGKMAASGAKLGDFQRMMGVRMQSESSEVLASFLKRDAAAGARKTLSESPTGLRDLDVLIADIDKLKSKQIQALVRIDRNYPEDVSGGARTELDTAFEKLQEAGRMMDAVSKMNTLPDEGNRDWAKFRAVLLRTHDKIVLAMAEANTAIASADRIVVREHFARSHKQEPVKGDVPQDVAEAPKIPKPMARKESTPVRQPKPARVKEPRVAAVLPEPPKSAKAGPDDVIADTGKKLPACAPGDPLGGVAGDCIETPLIKDRTTPPPAPAVAAAPPAKPAIQEPPAPAVKMPPVVERAPERPQVVAEAETVGAPPASTVEPQASAPRGYDRGAKFGAELDAILAPLVGALDADKSSIAKPAVPATPGASSGGLSSLSAPVAPGEFLDAKPRGAESPTVGGPVGGPRLEDLARRAREVEESVASQTGFTPLKDYISEHGDLPYTPFVLAIGNKNDPFIKSYMREYPMGSDKPLFFLDTSETISTEARQVLNAADINLVSGIVYAQIPYGRGHKNLPLGQPVALEMGENRELKKVRQDERHGMASR